MKKDVALVYLVAGMSSRFNGEIKQFSRVGLNGETLIEYSLMQALSAGFKKIIFVVGDKTEKGFREMFGDNYKGFPVSYVKQEFNTKIRKKPWGTVDALCCVKELIDCPFVVCNGDDIYGETSFKIMFNYLQENEGSATIGFRLDSMLSENCRVNRGIFEVDKDGYIESIREVFDIDRFNFTEKNLDINNLCNVNLFAFNPDVLDLLDVELKLFKERNHDNVNAECLLSIELSKLIEKGLIKIKLCETPDKWMGVTGPSDTEVVRKAILSQSL